MTEQIGSSHYDRSKTLAETLKKGDSQDTVSKVFAAIESITQDNESHATGDTRSSLATVLGNTDNRIDDSDNARIYKEFCGALKDAINAFQAIRLQAYDLKDEDMLRTISDQMAQRLKTLWPSYEHRGSPELQKKLAYKKADVQLMIDLSALNMEFICDKITRPTFLANKRALEQEMFSF